MVQRIAALLAQMPIVDPATGRLTPPALNVFSSIIQVIQGSGGLVEQASSGQATAPAAGMIATLDFETDHAEQSVIQALFQDQQISIPPFPVSRPEGTGTYFQLDNGIRISGGVGDPNGVVYGSNGDVWLRQDGGTLSTLYVKESGMNSQTGWQPK